MDRGRRDVVAHAAGRFVATQANRDAEPGDPTGPWAVLPDSALVTVPPAIAGIAKVGRTVRASAGRWDGAGLTFSYRWFAGARSLARAAGRTLEIPAAVAGRRLRVVVTAHRQGAAVGSAASPAVRVKPRPLSHLRSITCPAPVSGRRVSLRAGSCAPSGSPTGASTG